MDMAAPRGGAATPGELALPSVRSVSCAAPEIPDAAVISTLSSSRRTMTLRLVTVAVLFGVLASLLLAIPGLTRVAHDVRHADLRWIGIAVVLELGSCVSFVVIFRRFFDRMPRRVATEMAWTEMGVGALLPGGGVGSLAAGGWLLHLTGMSTERILRRSSGLFFLTTAASGAALIGGGLLLALRIGGGPHDPVLAALPIAAAALITALVVALPALTRPWRAAHPRLDDVVAGIAEAEAAAFHPTWRLLGAVGYLGFDIAVLWATLRSVGYAAPAGPVMLGYVIGYAVNILPIPGSVGILEGGLAGALILYGAPAAPAAAAVLLYHAIAFWVPSAGGLFAYSRVRRHLPAAVAEPTAPWDGDPPSRLLVAIGGGEGPSRPHRERVRGTARPTARR
jgi:uncharacterized membrane protein YbhN (UPF0104 family)